MRTARIIAAAHCVPEQVITNDDLSLILDTSDEWIASRTGIHERRISHDEKTSDLAKRVAYQLLGKSAVRADSLDFIIVATITPDSTMPSTAALVQAEIGATHAFAYDLSAACSGFIFALSTAEKFIRSGAYSRGIVIGVETLSKIVDWSDRSTAVLFGDGAAGVLVEAVEADKPMFVAEKLQTDGKRGKSLVSIPAELDSPYSKTAVDDSKKLTMDGHAIFDFAVRDVPKNISETLALSGLTADDIDYFLLHQANSRLLDIISKKLEFPREKFLQNMERYGNTSAASIPILLSETVKSGKIHLDGSQKIVLTGFGGGLTWGTLIINI